MKKTNWNRMMLCFSAALALASVIGSWTMTTPAIAQAGTATVSGMPEGADAVSGEFVFDEKCSTCHLGINSTVEGPALTNILGKKAGTEPDFKYTEALKNSGVTWDFASLDRFLTGPGAMVPGTDMKRALPEAADRADVIAYLATLKAQ